MLNLPLPPRSVGKDAVNGYIDGLRSQISDLESELREFKPEASPQSPQDSTSATAADEGEGDADMPRMYSGDGSSDDFDKANEAKMAAADLKTSGNYAAALGKYTEAVLAADPSALLLANRATCLFKLGNYAAAIRDCDAALFRNPDSAKSLRIRGETNLKLENYHEARKDLSAAQAIDWDSEAGQMLKEATTKCAEIDAAKVKERNDEEDKKQERLRKQEEEIRKAQEEANREAEKEKRRSSGGMGWKSPNPPVAPAKGRRKRDLVETSPTGRAKCQNCGKAIEKGTTRVGVQGQIKTAQGTPVWTLRYYHEGCVSETTKRKLHLGPPTPPAKRAKRSGVSPDSKKPRKKSTPKKATTRKSELDNNRRSLLKPRVRKQLEADLRLLRSRFAAHQGCDPCRIFPNRSLSDILARLPRNELELTACWGIKEKRLRQYGGSILTVVGSYLRDVGVHQTMSTGNGCVSVANPATPARGTEGASSAVSASGIEGSADDDFEVQSGPTLSVEEIVAQRVREAEARGEVLEII